MLREFVKRIGFGAVRSLGGAALARRVLRGRLRVLCYHGVVRDAAARGPRYRNTVSLAAFEAQLRSIVRRDRPVDLATVLAWVRHGTPLPERAVLVTFDDGYRNNLTVAAPALAAHGVPALVALSTALIGTREMLWPTELELRVVDGDWDAIPMPDSGELVPRPPDQAGREALADRVRKVAKGMSDAARRAWLERLRGVSRLALERVDPELVEFLDWNEVRRLADFGIALASHTVSHPILSKLEPDALERELRESKLRIERETGRACEAIVYPNGKPADISPAVFEAARRCGYVAGFDLDDHVNAARCTEPFRIRRLEVPAVSSLALFEARASGLYALARRRVAR